MTTSRPAGDGGAATPDGLRAVVFDLGGVVLDSPLVAVRAYEDELGLDAGSFARVLFAAGDGGAWQRLERGELEMDDFYDALADDCATAGCPVAPRELMRRIHRAEPRPRMLDAVARVRAAGLKTAALTNNWRVDGDFWQRLEPHFDVFVESWVVGRRKPDPKIYHRVLTQLEVDAEEAVFLDDIGANLKPARALGMTTIKVVEPDQALADLAEVLGFPV